jgi:hypothetical protein
MLLTLTGTLRQNLCQNCFKLSVVAGIKYLVSSRTLDGEIPGHRGYHSTIPIPKPKHGLRPLLSQAAIGLSGLSEGSKRLEVVGVESALSVSGISSLVPQPKAVAGETMDAQSCQAIQ